MQSIHRWNANFVLLVNLYNIEKFTRSAQQILTQQQFLLLMIWYIIVDIMDRITCAHAHALVMLDNTCFIHVKGF